MDIKYLIIGVILGWITKSPFLIKYYRRIKRDKEDMERILDNYKKFNQK